MKRRFLDAEGDIGHEVFSALFQWHLVALGLIQNNSLLQSFCGLGLSFELMFGRQPRLPIDLVLGLHPDASNHKTHSEYVKGLRQLLLESYSLAAKNSRKMGEKNKAGFDKKVRATELLEGDRVPVRNVNIRGKHKLTDRWQQ